MSFVMIATGTTSSGSRVRTLSLRSLWLGGGLMALTLLTAGVGLGCWVSTLAAPRAVEPMHAQPARPALPFTLEQLGALSGRLFKLESQASQLSERLGARTNPTAHTATAVKTTATPKAEPQPTTSQAGSGGPMLPPRLESEALAGTVTGRTRLTDMKKST